MRISDWISHVCSSDLKSPLFGGIRLLRAQLRVQGIAQRIAEQVEAEDGEADGDAREDRDPGRALGIFDGPAAQHDSPGRRRLLDAQTEIGERRLETDRLTDESQIGSAHGCTTVTNAHLVCRLLLENI